MDWPYRINVIAPVSITEPLNALWTIIAPNGDAEAESFGLPLSPTGQLPATHTMISTAATEEMRMKIEHIFPEWLADCYIEVQPHTVIDPLAFANANGLYRIEAE